MSTVLSPLYLEVPFTLFNVQQLVKSEARETSSEFWQNMAIFSRHVNVALLAGYGCGSSVSASVAVLASRVKIA